MQFSSSVFENKDALAKLAALNPLAEGAAAAAGSSTSASARAGGRTIKSSSGTTVGADRIGGAFTPEADAKWIKERDDILNAAIARTASLYEALDKPAITVTLPDGKQIAGQAHVTSPLDIATGIAKGLANSVCVASVKYSKRYPGVADVVEMATNPDGDEEAEGAEAEWEIWDVNRPVEGDCDLQLIKFDDPRGKEVFWHSSAHILGEALEGLYGARLTHGPPTENGFFYDSYMGENCTPRRTAAAPRSHRCVAAWPPRVCVCV